MKLNLKNNPTVEAPFFLTLTTDHAASSYGIPVLVDKHGNAFGPGDVLETGETGREFVIRYQTGSMRMGRISPENASRLVEGLNIEKCEWDEEPLMDILAPTKLEKLFLGL